MKMVYIDSEYRCHASNSDGTLREIEMSHFDGKCDAFIEGYRFIPAGESWTRSDGIVFQGEMIAPCKPYSELDDAQYKYELEQISEYSDALSEISAMIMSADAEGTVDTIVDAHKDSILSRINDMITALMTMEVEPVEE